MDYQLLFLGAAIATWGVLLGAWVNWRARTNQSPLPTLPTFRREAAPAEERLPAPPSAKSGRMGVAP